MDNSTISHYRILHKLGAGGMGEVYLAEDTKLGRKVALKLLSEGFTASKDRLQRFEQEAAAASALNHPNILTIHEVGVEDDKHFIATEFIDGETLRFRLGGAPIEISTALDIAIQVASALEEAHRTGIVHRDIKPENIMIRRSGQVKVLDFGLAKLTDTSGKIPDSDPEASTRVLIHTDAGVVMGTSHYMSPEQARGKVVDGRTDIWSLGVVMYEMVAGRAPFEGATATDVIVAITQKEAPPLARYNPELPNELEWIILKTLRKDPEERYQTAKELLSDLRQFKQRLEFQAELERSVAPNTSTTISNQASLPSESQRAVDTASSSGAQPMSSAEYVVTEIKRHKTGALVIVIGLVALAIVATLIYLRPAKALTDKDTIVLADFVNMTGEPVFDSTLKQALAVQLGQSPYLNIFPEEQVRETLRFMGRSPDERVTRDVAREICLRQNLKAMLVGSISSLGNHYVITLEALNAQSGEAIAREQLEAQSKEQVLATIGKATSLLREKLGESLNSIKKFDVPIEQATTSSLEALRAYALGDEQRTKGEALKSLPFYKRAIELDPNFAIAYARLAVHYGNTAELGLSQNYAQKAYELRDRVSERERFYISEKYHSYITGNVEKAIEVLQTWSRSYPNDYVPQNNLAVNYRFIGKYDEALKAALEALRLEQSRVTAHTNVIASFIRMNRYDEAQQAVAALEARYPDVQVAHFFRYLIAFIRGDLEVMQREIQWASGKDLEADLLGDLSRAESFSGRLKMSEGYVNRAVDLYKKQQRSENASQVMSSLALNQAVVGRCREATETARKGLQFARGRIGITESAAVFALCNDAPAAQSLLDEALKLYPEDTGVVSIITPIVRAQLERNRGNPAQAVQLLESVRRYELGEIARFWCIYVRGLAYLDQKQGSEAAGEFHRILDHRGIDITSVLYSLARLGLARSLALTGDTSRSRKEYQDFLAAWKDADSDLPILVAARQEYEELQ